MSRWWRAEDTSIDHPKLLLLSDAMHRAWYTLMCVASANDGELPPVEHIAARLRMKPGQVAAWITHLVTAGLFDNDAGTFRPHNWARRQYKTDVTDPTNATRQKRYREKHRNAVTTVTDKRPETEADTEQKQKPEANASGADAPGDARTRLFREGLSDLAEITGKGPDACRSFVGKCLQAAGDDAVVVLGLIEDAKRNRVANASAWIAARLKGTTNERPKSSIIQAADDLRRKLASFDGPARGTEQLRSGEGEASPRLLSNG
jgi:hypothetical protein